jgi:hypothetical protein
MKIAFTYLLLTFLSLTICRTFAQKNTVGGTIYPDSLKLNNEYKYEISNDTIIQSITIKAIGNERIWFEITTSLKDSSLAKGHNVTSYTGIAKWDFAYGTESDKGISYTLEWDYKTADNLLTITIYGNDASAVSLSTTKYNETRMKLKQ